MDLQIRIVMAKIPFSIDYRPQIESGEYKVETGDGRSVRIISWDKKVFGGRTEIVALVPTPEGNTETVQLYCPDGTLIVSSWNEKFKLFIVTPEEELTEFESGLFSAFSDGWQQYLGGEEVNVVEWAKEHSTELLSLAKQQLLQFGELLTQEHHEKLMETLREECTKNLPRWKKFAPNVNDPLSAQQICAELKNSVMRVDDAGYCWIISRKELNKLPKED